MRIIAGLGNPGKKYENTRHNAGFLFLDNFAHHFQASFSEEKKFTADIAEITFKNEKVLLVKPSTFMNNSGSSVAALLHYYKMKPSDLLVVHDDLDVKEGTFKATAYSRAAGHNGVQNIIDTLGTQDFQRIRLGIGRPKATEANPEVCLTSHDYVLSPFPGSDRKQLELLFPEVVESVTHWLNNEHAS